MFELVVCLEKGVCEGLEYPLVMMAFEFAVVLEMED
jgi:hypothetical protein